MALIHWMEHVPYGGTEPESGAEADGPESAPASVSAHRPDAGGIRALTRACAVLRAFSAERPRLTLGELAGGLGLPKATVHRILSTLIAEGLMSQAPDGRYELGFGLIGMGEIARRHLELVDVCANAMAAIARFTDETVLLAQVDWPAREIAIIERIDSPHPLAILSAVGHRSPIYPGALGRAALAGASEAVRAAVLADEGTPAYTPRTRTDPAEVRAGLERAAACGYAIDDDEFLEGTAGVAVPVVYDGERPRGAIGIVGPSTRLASERLHDLGRMLLESTVSLRHGAPGRRAA